MPALSIAVIIASLDSSKLRYSTRSPRRHAACTNVLASVVLPVPLVPESRMHEVLRIAALEHGVEALQPGGNLLSQRLMGQFRLGQRNRMMPWSLMT